MDRTKRFELCCSNCEKSCEIDSDEPTYNSDWLRRNVYCRNKSPNEKGFPIVQASNVCWEWSNKMLEIYFK
jgi:hypothetical protein